MKQPCWKCGGTGKVYNMNLTNYETSCPICGGTGYLYDTLVAIYKTETTSCENGKTKTEKKYDDFRSYNAQGDCYKYVCSCNNCGQMLWEVADYNYGQGEKGHTPNYCPNCGRKLKENAR